MTFDANMAALALKLITKRGKTLVFSRIVQLPYDPSTGTASTTTTTTTIKALVQDYSRASDGLAFLGGLVLEGDKRVTIAASSLTAQPLPGDRVAFDTFTMSVQSVKVTFAGELPVTYECRVRT